MSFTAQQAMIRRSNTTAQRLIADVRKAIEAETDDVLERGAIAESLGDELRQLERGYEKQAENT